MVSYSVSKRANDSLGYCCIDYDDTFADSLLRINFFYPQLIYIAIPGIGKKLYNGTITLNASKVSFPLKIDIRTASGNQYFIVDSKNKQEQFVLKVPHEINLQLKSEFSLTAGKFDLSPYRKQQLRDRFLDVETNFSAQILNKSIDVIIKEASVSVSNVKINHTEFKIKDNL